VAPGAVGPSEVRALEQKVAALVKAMEAHDRAAHGTRKATQDRSSPLATIPCSTPAHRSCQLTQSQECAMLSKDHSSPPFSSFPPTVSPSVSSNFELGHSQSIGRTPLSKADGGGAAGAAPVAPASRGRGAAPGAGGVPPLGG